MFEKYRFGRTLVLIATTVALLLGVHAWADDDDDDPPKDPMTYRVMIQNLTEGQPLSPPVAATHRGGLRLFKVGQRASDELEAIARDGDQMPMFDLLSASGRVYEVVDLAMPLTPYGTAVGSFGDAAEFTILGREGDKLSLATMLVCTNDGFVGLDRANPPKKGSAVFTLHGYDSGTEDNTEMSADIVDACSVLGPITLAGDPNGNLNTPVNTIPPDRIMGHPGVLGGGDLGPIHQIPARVAKVTVTRVADGGIEFSTPLSGAGEVPVVDTDASGEARFKLGGHGDDDCDDDGDDDCDDDDWRRGRSAWERSDLSSALGADVKDHFERDELWFSIRARHIVGVTGAHIHLGLPNENGPVVATLFAPTEDSDRVEGNLAMGRLTEDDLIGGPFEGDFTAFIDAMSHGELYVNVHTAEFPGGEIRGQIGVRKARGGAPGNRPPNGTIVSPDTDPTVAPGESVYFDGTADDPDGDPVTVEWDFGDGTTSTDLTPGDHTYDTAGTYQVTFTATDDHGLSDPTPDTRTVTVGAPGNQAPEGTITDPAGDVTITEGDSVFFSGAATDPDGDPVTVEWDFGDGTTSTDLMPGDHAYNTAGTYLVTFTATDDQGLSDPSPDTRTITVENPNNQAPEGTIAMPTGNVTITAGESVFFSGTATDPDGDPVTVEWDFGDGSTSTELTPGDHTYGSAGTYLVTFTATDDQGLSDPTPDTRTITVDPAPNQPPQGTITMPAGDVTITAGESVFFSGTATDPDGDPVTVEWDFGDGMTSTALAPGNHTYDNPGTYLVTFTATDDQGLSDPTPDTRTITVDAAPSVTLTAIQSSIFSQACTGCHGGSNPTAGMNLEAGQSYANLVNVPATTQNGTRVVPFQPDNSVLVTFLDSGHRNRPASERQMIRDWISAGAQNN